MSIDEIHAALDASTIDCDVTDEIIKLLSEKQEQELCDDTVSRQKILNKINEIYFSEKWMKFRFNNGSNGLRDFLIDYIKHMPSTQAKQKPAHWNEDFICSNCGCKCYPLDIDFGDYNYCPNCGCYMEEGDQTV